MPISSISTSPDQPRTPRTLCLRSAALASLMGALLLTTACSIETDKKGSGDSDNVKISTPFGGMQVNANSVDAASVGLPAYPGATLLKKKETGEDGSVDLHMGFGPWQMRLKVASYDTPDAQDKVIAFYRSALSKSGDVVECSGNNPIGKPVETSEGLSCSDHDTGGSTKWNKSGVNINDNDVELKTGSRHRQHIVGFKQVHGLTHISLIALELPNTDKDQETN